MIVKVLLQSPTPKPTFFPQNINMNIISLNSDLTLVAFKTKCQFLLSNRKIKSINQFDSNQNANAKEMKQRPHRILHLQQLAALALAWGLSNSPHSWNIIPNQVNRCVCIFVVQIPPSYSLVSFSENGVLLSITSFTPGFRLSKGEERHIVPNVLQHER